jgi:hypothetical protein
VTEVGTGAGAGAGAGAEENLKFKVLKVPSENFRLESSEIY